MYTATTLLTTILAAAPTSGKVPSQLTVDHVTATSDGAEIIAYDKHGTVVASIVAMSADRGAIIAADFDDDVEVIAGNDAVDIMSDLPQDVIEARMSAIGAALDDASTSESQAGKFTCAAGAVASVLACARLSLWCPVAILATMCTCSEAFDQPVTCP